MIMIEEEVRSLESMIIEVNLGKDRNVDMRVVGSEKKIESLRLKVLMIF